MAQGEKSKYTGKQKRKAEHIEEGYEKRGVSKNEAESRAWATVNKEESKGRLFCLEAEALGLFLHHTGDSAALSIRRHSS